MKRLLFIFALLGALSLAVPALAPLGRTRHQRPLGAAQYEYPITHLRLLAM